MLKLMILVVEEGEEEVKGQGDHNHPLVLDGDHDDECDGLDGNIKLHLNHKSLSDRRVWPQA